MLDPPSGISEGTAQIKITYPIYNGGQTPALFIGDHSRVSVGSGTADIRGNYTLDRPQTAVVPPRGAHPLNPSHTSELSYEEFNDVKDRRKTLYFSGVLTYLDMFDKERHTWFTLSYTGPAGYKFNMAFETAKGLNRFD